MTEGRSWVSVGIDPGLHGAIAFITSDEDTWVVDTPIIAVMRQGREKYEYDVPRIAEMLQIQHQAFARMVAVVEHVSARPGQGVTSMFNLGQGLGLWKGVLGTLGISYRIVTAVSWKGQYSLLGKGKQASRVEASRRYPNVTLTLKKHDGRADALFLAQYGIDVTWAAPLRAQWSGLEDDNHE